jgi:hypothetical protein
MSLYFVPETVMICHVVVGHDLAIGREVRVGATNDPVGGSNLGLRRPRVVVAVRILAKIVSNKKLKLEENKFGARFCQRTISFTFSLFNLLLHQISTL